ncbi:Diaminopimelate decarboxylase [Candidatus Terasakiella magnetica]|uniref:ornithine decarboxylase n=1 Tax=Candidatus Terasakiella magnetica TaxID=1867952 RepID=A0A1C3RBX6_9PROT|nr:type III PLP-dependent enzyme [Candidatus Terasakiella magnetica]SCA54783.1 Diaminopimelate decarboxylase [Candidatus Terasakiella magnetica]
MTPKIEAFLKDAETDNPFLVVDLDVVEDRYRQLHSSFEEAHIYYAMKANPAKPILERLNKLGSSFDAASLAEIQQCLDAGVTPDRISFGNTLKKKKDIKAAFDLGVDLFVFDCIDELEKIAEVAPGARVYCRILVNRHGAGASWPLSRKFGCSSSMAHELMVRAKALGLVPFGISFHVGSQQLDPAHWGKAIADVAVLFDALGELGITLKMVNIGGGFPARYQDDIPALDDFISFIKNHMKTSFGENWPEIYTEPGRYIVAEAGVLQSEVVCISIKDFAEEIRWVYLDVGKFGGLAETIDESIIYQIATDYDEGEMGPVIIAGPTCDSCDTLYERTFFQLPLDLKTGDRVRILSAGAYTTMYASQGFNGFTPPEEYFV